MRIYIGVGIAVLIIIIVGMSMLPSSTTVPSISTERALFRLHSSYRREEMRYGAQRHDHRTPYWTDQTWSRYLHHFFYNIHRYTSILTSIHFQYSSIHLHPSLSPRDCISGPLRRSLPILLSLVSVHNYINLACVSLSVPLSLFSYLSALFLLVVLKYFSLYSSTLQFFFLYFLFFLVQNLLDQSSVCYF